MLSNVSQVLPNSKKIKKNPNPNYNKMFFFTAFFTDNKIIDFISPTALKIASLHFLRSRMIIAMSEIQAIVKLNQSYVLSPVLRL